MTQGLRSPTLFSGSQICSLIFQSSVKGSLRKRTPPKAGTPPKAPKWISMFPHTWTHPGPGHPEALWSQEETMSWPSGVS